MRQIPFALAAAVTLAVLSNASGVAAESPPGGLFQITSGRYEVYGGFAGSLSMKLPMPPQAFVSLEYAGDGQHADLKVLGEDRQTVQLALTGGNVIGSVIHFYGQRPHPQFPGVIEVTDYVVTNARPVLSFSGAVQFEPPPCCDIQYYFGHTNVVAVELPTLSIRTSAVELCWEAAADVAYQLQSSPDLGTGAWSDVGSPRTGTGGRLCVTEAVPAEAPRAYYRIVPVVRRGLGR